MSANVNISVLEHALTPTLRGNWMNDCLKPFHILTTGIFSPRKCSLKRRKKKSMPSSYSHFIRVQMKSLTSNCQRSWKNNSSLSKNGQNCVKNQKNYRYRAWTVTQCEGAKSLLLKINRTTSSNSFRWVRITMKKLVDQSSSLRSLSLCQLHAPASILFLLFSLTAL